MATAAPLICRKLTKSDSPGALESEMMRTCHFYKNDVDLSLSHMNQNWVRGESLERSIEDRIAELNLKRKLRSDAVKAEGIIVSVGDMKLPAETAMAFLNEANDWLDNRYGAENTVAWSIHMDEGTPHLHRWQVPVIAGKNGAFDRVSARDLFGPKALHELQVDFYTEVSSKYGFGKPLDKQERAESGVKYGSFETYKRKNEAAKIETELAETRDAIENTKAILEKTTESVIETTREYDKKVVALEKIERSIEFQNKAAEAARGKTMEAVAEMRRAHEQVEEAQQQAAGLQTRVEKLQDQAKTLKKEIEDLEGTRDELVREVGSLESKEGMLRKAVEKLESIASAVIARLESYLPNPLLQLARFFRDNDRLGYDSWHDDMDYAAEMLSFKLPTRAQEEWDAMLDNARAASDFANQGRDEHTIARDEWEIS